jgi:hypothetical protein
MEKQLENPGKQKKPKQPKPAHPAQRGHMPACPRRLTGGRHLSVAVSSPVHSLSLPSGARLSAPVAFTLAPLFPLSLTGLLRQTSSRCPTRSLSLSLSRCAVGPPLSVPPSPRPAVDQRARTSLESLATSPAHAPSSFFSTARARTHSPVPFRTASLSLALCPCRSASPETRAHRAGLLARRRPRQATPSSAPR